MKNRTKFSVILGVLFLASCASNIKTTKASGVNFEEFKTFAYWPSTSIEMNGVDGGSDESVESSLITSMNNEMVNKGYAVNNENPDLLLLLRARKEFNSNENTKSKYERASSGGSSGSSPNFASTGGSGGTKYLSSNEDAATDKPFKEGSLVLEVYNGKTKQLVWAGAAKNFKSHISDQTLMEQMLKAILRKFPE